MNNLELSFFDSIYSDEIQFAKAEAFRIAKEIDSCWEEYEEYIKEKYFWKTEDDLWWDRWDHEFDLMEYVYDMTEWDINELEDYIHLCELCGIHVETETAEDVLAVWKEMERFWNGSDDYEEELLAESEVEERPTRTRADRRKNAFKAKARRVEILKNKGFSPEYEYCEKWLRQGKKLSEIRSKKSKDNEKNYKQARKARRNPNLSGKGNAYRKTTRGWFD